MRRSVLEPSFPGAAPGLVAVLCCLFGAVARGDAALDAELDDLATRVDFGYYASDHSVVRAAEKQLERLPVHDRRVRYLRALAALRGAQLALAEQADADVGDLLERCVELVEPEEEDASKAPIRVARTRDPAAAEAWTLTAGCAAVATHVEPSRSAAHRRRLDRALARARAADPSNPRLELVEAWAVTLRPAAAADEVRAAAATALEEAIAAFAAFGALLGGNDALAADWGEAEALALLAEIRVRDGARREARDLVERALLAAPGYTFAEMLARAVRGEPSRER
jgi:hypothetical protein